MKTRLLVLSANASAINYVQSLGADPAVDLHVTDSDRFSPGLYGSGITAHSLPAARETARYRAALDRIIAENQIEALIPTSDYDVEGVVAYLHDGWQPPVTLFRPTFESFENLNDTSKLAGILDRTLPHLRPLTLSGDEDLHGLSLPVVLKPLNLSGGKGVEIVASREDLAAAIRRMETQYGRNFVAQEFIPGRTYVSTLVYDHQGAMVTAVAMRSTMTFFTWGGGGIAGEMVDEPGLTAIAQQVVEACGGWRGPINLEWRRHPDNARFYLMEANCRLNGYSYLTTMNGINLPKIALATLLGKPVPTFVPAKPSRNFVIGYREMPVESWVEGAT